MFCCIILSFQTKGGICIIVTLLDYLVVAFALLSAAGLISVLFMFLSKNKSVRSFCLYFTAALGIYACTISIRLFWPYFMGQLYLGLLLGILSVTAMLLWRKHKGQASQGVAARIMASFSFIAGILNAFAI